MIFGAPAPAGVATETVRFHTGAGEFSGTLHLPDEADRPAPLLICYHAASGGSASFPFYDHLETDLPEAGIATFLWDRRGTNNQPGSFSSATFEDLARDGLAALDVLIQRDDIDPDRTGAWGISQGAWIAPLAANLSDEIDFLITVSACAVTPADQMSWSAAFHLREAGYDAATIDTALDLRACIDAYHRNPANREDLQARIDAHRAEPWFSLAFLPMSGNLPADPITTKWYQEMDFDPAAPLAELSAPLLAIYGAQDRWIPVRESVETLRRIVAPELLTVYLSEESGHLISGHAEPPRYGSAAPGERDYLEAMIGWIEALQRQP